MEKSFFLNLHLGKKTNQHQALRKSTHGESVKFVTISTSINPILTKIFSEKA